MKPFHKMIGFFAHCFSLPDGESHDIYIMNSDGTGVRILRWTLPPWFGGLVGCDLADLKRKPPLSGCTSSLSFPVPVCSFDKACIFEAEELVIVNSWQLLEIC